MFLNANQDKNNDFLELLKKNKKVFSYENDVSLEFPLSVSASVFMKPSDFQSLT